GGVACIVMADFNGDGAADLGVCRETGNFGVLLGNGDGTFQSVVNSGNPALYMAVGDFNGDGITDIATTAASGGVSIGIGNGDGTFQTPVSYELGLSGSSTIHAIATG